MTMELPEIVTDQTRLAELCQAWRAAGRFSFDTEFIRDDTFHAHLCLIQVATDEDVVLIDPTADIDVDVFWELVCADSVRQIVHAGKEDFEVCLRSTGKPPRNVFDVQLGAGFVGCGYPLSLTRLVDQVLHRRITKAQTLTDWLRRPLTKEQIRYAVEDVVHLPKLYEKLVARLDETGRAAWAQEEFKRFEDPEFYRPPIEDRLFKLKGSKRLDSLGLAILARLVEWRENWAKERNRPQRALMRDDVLVEIARLRPKDPGDLEVMRGFPQARNRRVVNELIQLIAEAGKTLRSQWPKPFEPHEDTPMTKATLDILSAVTRAVCWEEKVSHELVGGTQRLRELIDYLKSRPGERPALLTGWRRDFIGERLVDLLKGRCELHLDGWPDAPRLRVVTEHSPGRP